MKSIIHRGSRGDEQMNSNNFKIFITFWMRNTIHKAISITNVE